MSVLKCLLSSPESRAYAKKHNMNERIVLQKMDTWQTVTSNERMPSDEELTDFISEQGDIKMTQKQRAANLMYKAIQDKEVVKVSVDNTNYYVNKNGVIIRLKDCKIMNFDENNPTYQELMEKASEILGTQTLAPDSQSLEGASQEEPASQQEQPVERKKISKPQKLGNVTFTTTTNDNYRLRTIDNIKKSDVTIAIADSFNTAGEQLTAREAREAGKYVKVRFNGHGADYINAIIEQIKEVTDGNLDNLTINIAGNGVYTLLKYKHSQEDADAYVYWLLKQLQEKGVTIKAIRSGGQTGIDEAGIKAAMFLGIDSTVHGTLDYKLRNAEGKDIMDEDLFKKRFSPEKISISEWQEPVEEKKTTKYKVVYEDISAEDQKQLNQAKEKTKSFTLHTQIGDGAAVWRACAYQHGFEKQTIPASDAKEWMSLSMDEKKMLNGEYRSLMAALRRNAEKVPLTTTEEDLKGNWELRSLIEMLISLKHLQDADSLFVIGHIVAPGEEYSVNGMQFTNQSKKPEVTGRQAVLVKWGQKHLKKGKPLPMHIYDDTQESWFTWDGAKFVKEDTPTLTEKAFLASELHGQEWSKDNALKPFKAVGTKNIQAIYDVFNKTFGLHLSPFVRYSSSKHESRELSIEEYNETFKALFSEMEDFEPAVDTKPMKASSPLEKLNIAMNPRVRMFRKDMITRKFSSMVSALYRKDLQEQNPLKDDYEQYSQWINDNKPADNATLQEKKIFNRRKNAKKRGLDKKKWYYDRLKKASETEARQLVVQKYTFGGIINMMRDEYESIANNDQYPQKVRQEYQKVLDNYDQLVFESISDIGYNEDFQVSHQLNKIKRTADKVQRDNEEFKDDDEGNRVTGNDGWSYRVRFIDPQRTLSARTKHILNSLPMLDENGVQMTDDLGNRRYLNGAYTYAVLMDKLKDMIDADDFSVGEEFDTDPETGQKYPVLFTYPFLERIKLEYPWVQTVIDQLEEDNQATASFFHDFNMCFIHYTKVDSNGKLQPLNSPTSTEAVFSTMERNYQHNVQLSENCIYTEGGVDKNKAKALLERWKKLSDLTRNTKNFDPTGDAKAAIPNLNDSLGTNNTVVDVFVDTMNALGFNMSTQYAENVFPVLFEKDKKGKIPFKRLDSAVKDILGSITDKNGGKNKVKEDTQLNVLFRKQLRDIASNVGKMTGVVDVVQSCRDGKDARYSFSPPNFWENFTKIMQRDDRRHEHLIDAYSKDPWFYDDKKGWKNEWLKILDSDTEESKYYRSILECGNNILIGTEDSSTHKKGENKKYGEWRPADVYKTLFANFFKFKVKHDGMDAAGYVMPVFADSPVCMSINMKRYTGTEENPDAYKDQILDLLVGVAHQELDRMSLVRIRRHDGASKIQNFDDTGEQFRFFPELNDLSYRGLIDDALSRNPHDSLDNVLRKCLSQIMETKYMEFMNDLTTKWDLSDVGDQFVALGLLKKDELPTISPTGKSNEEREKVKKLLDEKYQAILDSNLENFFWNHIFAQSQIIQIANTDLAYSKNAVDFIKRNKQSYAAGKRLNTNVKYGRKYEHTLYLKDHIQTSSRYDSIKKVAQRAVAEGRMNKQHMKWLLDGAKKINTADAQAYRNPYALRAVLAMNGTWTDEMDECFNRIVHGEWDAGDLAVIWQTIKPFMFSHIMKDNEVRSVEEQAEISSHDPYAAQREDLVGKYMRVPHQNKNSEFVVLAFYDMISASLSDNEFLKGLGEFFEKHQDIDVIQFESAVKMGQQECINLNYNEKTLRSKVKEFDSQGMPLKQQLTAKQVITYLNSVYNDKGLSHKDYQQYISSLDVSSNSVQEVLESLSRQWVQANKNMSGLQLIQLLNRLRKNEDISYDDYQKYIDSLDVSSDSLFKVVDSLDKQDFNILDEVTYKQLKKVLDNQLDDGTMSQDEYNDIIESLECTSKQIVNVLEEALKDKDGIIDIEGGKFNHNRVHQMPYSDYMIAQPTPPHYMDITEATSGSQFRYQILANLSPSFNITLNVGGKNVDLNRTQIRSLYRGATVENLLESIGKCINIFGNIETLQQKLLQMMDNNPKYGNDIRQALQIIEIPDKNKPGVTRKVFALPLDLPTITNQVQELVTSIFRHNVTEQTINGGAVIQVAPVGYTKRLNIERREDGTIIGAHCLLPANTKKFYENYLVEDGEDANGNPIQKIDFERIKKDAPELLEMIGYRIPTENKYSMLPLIVDGFTPAQNGGVIMLPADITYIAGSDFDKHQC